MKIAVLGAGMVGQNISQSLAAKGHSVMIGTRDAAKALTTTELSPYGMPAFGVWHKEHGELTVGSFAEAISFGDIVINAANGIVSLDALKQGRAETAGGKILIDVANKLQPVKGGMAKSLASDDTSLGEEIQTAFPNLKVVKTLSTVNTYVMTNPASVEGDTTVFIAGNNDAAKATVTGLLRNFGWTGIIDLGDVTGARGVEMMMAIWLRLWGVIGNTPFNFKVVRQPKL
jgi:8-hydroxy-5-deazaflavin:NADPH oxidoreductase